MFIRLMGKNIPLKIAFAYINPGLIKAKSDRNTAKDLSFIPPTNHLSLLYRSISHQLVGR